MDKNKIRQLIINELEKIRTHETKLDHGCAACHVMFSLKNNLDSSEQDCADFVSQILTEDKKLNQDFIETVEQIHMSERGMGGAFVFRERESKDAYLNTYLTNVLDELSSDLIVFSPEILLRKLLLVYLSLYRYHLAQINY